MKDGRRFRFGIGWRSCAAAGVRGTRPFAKNAKERGTRSGGDASQNQESGPPALKKTRMGHPLLKQGTQKSVKVDHPPAHQDTVNVVALLTVPAGVTTWILPVFAPAGTVAVI